MNGAGAAAIACIKLYEALGAKRENFMVFDSKGLIHAGRTDLDDLKKEFIYQGEAVTLEQALDGCDVFIGLSKGNVLTQDMVKKMAKNPIVFAMANPTPK